MRNGKHEKGSTVYMNPSSDWVKRERACKNPIGVEGTVTGVTDSRAYVIVEWGNGEYNIYNRNNSDLLTPEEWADFYTSPFTLFKRKLMRMIT